MSDPKITLIQGLDNQENVLLGLAQKKAKIAVLGRSLNLQFTTNFVSTYNPVDRMFTLSYPQNFDLFTLKQQLQSQPRDEQLVGTVMVPGDILGMNFDIKELTDDGMICYFPKSLYQINRRSSRRCKVAAQHITNMYIEFTLPLVSATPIILPLIDISVHGLSFKCPAHLKPIFKQGSFFPNVHLRLGSKDIVVVLEIRNQFTNQESKYPFKVGVKFQKITPDSQIEIQKYIVSQTPKPKVS